MTARQSLAVAGLALVLAAVLALTRYGWDGWPLVLAVLGLALVAVEVVAGRL